MNHPPPSPIIVPVEHLTFSMLHDSQAKVQYLTRLIIDANGHANPSILAGTLIEQGGKRTYLYLRHHSGHGSWQLISETAEGVTMPKQQIQTGQLPALIQQFETLTGVTLPSIAMLVLGIGLIDAKSQFLTDNPFAMQDNCRYHVVNRRGIGRDLLARVSHGQTRIAVLNGQTAASEFFDPALILSPEEWMSLKPATQRHSAAL